MVYFAEVAKTMMHLCDITLREFRVWERGLMRNAHRGEGE